MKLRTKFFKALNRTRSSISEPIKALKRKRIDENLLIQLETSLISSDVGLTTTDIIIEKLKKDKTTEPISLIKSVLSNHLPKKDNISKILSETVVFIVGVNGTGKTTTSAKLANYLSKQNQKLFMIGADTYRAAAAAQLEEWANRMKMDIVCNSQSGDPSAVLFDGLKSAKKKASDIIIVDTAGRLHTYKNLMAELEKMVRIVDKHFVEFKINTLLTIDASLGQNSLIQAREFAKLFKIDGAILTKMDGTAKGGIAIPLYEELKIPVMFIGIGEQLNDLIPFNPEDYVNSLIGNDDNTEQ